MRTTRNVADISELVAAFQQRRARMFLMAFSPECEDPGNPYFGTSTIPKVVGGFGWEALTLALVLYGELLEKTAPVSSAATAEAVKLTGVAYKKNVDDMRQSPSLKLIELIEARGTRADYHDPFISMIPITREHAELAGRRSVPLDPATISRYDAVLIATDHDDVDYRLIVQNARVIVDTRNACQKSGFAGTTILKA